MFNVVYWSNAARPFTDGELFEMLACWREKNERFGITGLLLYKEGAFIQTLEGEEAPVRALYAAIAQTSGTATFHHPGEDDSSTPVPELVDGIQALRSDGCGVCPGL